MLAPTVEVPRHGRNALRPLLQNVRMHRSQHFGVIRWRDARPAFSVVMFEEGQGRFRAAPVERVVPVRGGYHEASSGTQDAHEFLA